MEGSWFSRDPLPLLRLNRPMVEGTMQKGGLRSGAVDFATLRGVFFAAIALALAIAAFIHLVFPILTIGNLAERNFNEGWNVYHALRAAQGGVMYDADPWRVNNYPFLSFYLIAGLDRLVGDLLLTGRLVAILSLGVTAISGALVVRSLGGRALEMAVTACAIPAFFHLTAPAWTGTDDPQSLGHAFMAVGLAVYVADRRSLRHLAWTALFLALGGFTKHNLVAVPVAVTVDILFDSRRRFLIWCSFGAISCAALLVAIKLIAGGDFLGHLLTPRVYLWDHIAYHARKFLITFKLPMLVAIVLLCRSLPGGQGVLLRAYGGAALLSALYFAGGDGTSFNIFLDCAIFLGIASGLAIGQARRSLPEGYLRRFAVLAVPVLALWPAFSRLPQPVDQLRHLPGALALAAGLDQVFGASRDYVASRPGAAVCESLLLCWRAGKPFTLDNFNIRQQVLAGGLDQGPLLARIRAKEFGVIQTSGLIEGDQPGELNPRLTEMNRFTDEFLRAVQENYRLAEDAPRGLYAFYIPR